MSAPLTIGGVQIPVPQQGDSFLWGTSIFNALQQIANILNGQPGLRVTNTTAQTGISGATTLKLDNVVTDTDSAYSTGTGIFTVPAGKGGWYDIDASVGTLQSTSTGNQVLTLLNGATAIAKDTAFGITAGTFSFLGLSTKIFLAAGQTLLLQLQTSAGTVGTNASDSSTTFTIKRLI